MSSSEMGSSLGPTAPGTGATAPREPLTMIPLTSASEGGAGARAGAGGADSPRSAASSGDWQLVGAAGEEELEAVEGEPAGPTAAAGGGAK